MLMAAIYWMRAQAQRFAPEDGQDFIEYALIVGVLAIVLILAFLTTDVQTAVTNLSKEVACLIGGGSWTGTTCDTGA